MAQREIIRIDEAKCDGCGLCVPACVEGAIAVVDGKARLLSEAACDGLGACLGRCPQGAITIERVEAAPFDAEAAAPHHAASDAVPRPEPALGLPRLAAPTGQPSGPHAAGGGCPGSRAIAFEPAAAGCAAERQPSALRQWPVQLHLVSPGAPYFRGADVLLAADCVAYALGDFHAVHLAGRSLAIACPKLDAGQESYLDRLVALIDHAGIASLTVMVMEVPCCSGLVRLAQLALARAQRPVPLRVVVVGVRGDVLSDARGERRSAAAPRAAQPS